MKPNVKKGVRCSCASLSNGTETDRSSVRSMLLHGSRVDKLYAGKYVPLRERRLLAKLVRTRAIYDDVRQRLLCSNEKLNNAADSEDNSAVLQLIDMVDRGDVTGGKTFERCSCCSCISDIANDNLVKRQRYDRYLSSKSSMISKKLTGKRSRLKKRTQHNTKQIRSDPCTCTCRLSGTLKKNHSKEAYKRYSMRSQTIIDGPMRGLEEKPTKSRKVMRRAKDSFEKIKDSKNTIHNKIKVSCECLVKKQGHGKEKDTNFENSFEGNIKESVDEKTKKSLKRLRKRIKSRPKTESSIGSSKENYTRKQRAKKVAKKSYKTIKSSCECFIGNAKKYEVKIKKSKIAEEQNGILSFPSKDSLEKHRITLKKKQEANYCQFECNKDLCSPEECMDKINKLTNRARVKNKRIQKQVLTQNVSKKERNVGTKGGRRVRVQSPSESEITHELQSNKMPFTSENQKNNKNQAIQMNSSFHTEDRESTTKSPHHRHKISNTKLKNVQNKVHALKRCFCILQLKSNKPVSKHSNMNSSFSTTNKSSKHSSTSQASNYKGTPKINNNTKVSCKCGDNSVEKRNKKFGVSKTTEEFPKNKDITIRQDGIRKNSEKRSPTQKLSTMRITSSLRFNFELLKEANVDINKTQNRTEKPIYRKKVQKHKSITTALKQNKMKLVQSKKNIKERNKKSLNSSRGTSTSLVGYPEIETRSVATEKRDNLKLLPYECEPGICIPFQCNPMECRKQIKKRLYKSRRARSKHSMTAYRETHSSSTFTSTPSRNKKVQTFDKSKLTTKITDTNFNVMKKGLKITSSISYSIDITKSRSDNLDSPKIINSKQYLNNITKINIKHQGSRGDYKTHDKVSSTATLRKRTNAFVSPAVKRCFCTLQLHKIGRNKKLKEIKIASTLPVSTYLDSNRLVSNKSTLTKQDVRRRKKCNPYTCIDTLERNKDNTMKSVCSNTFPSNYRSVSSSFEKSHGETKSICVRSILKNKVVSTDRKTETLTPEKSLLSPPIQKIYSVSSSISFSIELNRPNYKNTKADRTVDQTNTPIDHMIRTDQKILTRHHQVSAPITKKKEQSAGAVLKKCFCALQLQKKNKLQKYNKPKVYTISRVSISKENILTFIPRPVSDQFGNWSTTKIVPLKRNAKGSQLDAGLGYLQKISNSISIKEVRTNTPLLKSTTISSGESSMLIPLRRSKRLAIQPINNVVSNMDPSKSNLSIRTSHFECKTCSITCNLKTFENTRIERTFAKNNRLDPIPSNSVITVPKNYSTVDIIHDKSFDEMELKNSSGLCSKDIIRNKNLPSINYITDTRELHSAEETDLCYDIKNTSKLKDTFEKKNYKQVCSDNLCASNIKVESKKTDSFIRRFFCKENKNILRRPESKDTFVEKKTLLEKCFSKFKWLGNVQSESFHKNPRGQELISSEKTFFNKNYYPTHKKHIDKKKSLECHNDMNKINHKKATNVIRKGLEYAIKQPLKELNSTTYAEMDFSLTNSSDKIEKYKMIEKYKKSTCSHTNEYYATMSRHYTHDSLYNSKKCLYSTTDSKIRQLVSKNDIFKQSIYTMRAQTKLEPYECEPGFCVPYQCDPYECEKRIKKRNVHSKHSSTDVSYVSKSNMSNFGSTKHKKSQSYNRRQVNHTNGVYIHKNKSEKNSGKRGVRISSKVSFNVEIYKGSGGLSHRDPENGFDRGDRQRIEHKLKHGRKGISSISQTDFVGRDSRGSGMDPLLTRCFCTLKLHKAGKNKKLKTSGTVSEIPGKTKLKNTQKNAATATKKAKYNLKPYECEPYVCVPGKCDPYECYERIKKRRTREVSVDTMGKPKCTTGSSTYNDRKYRNNWSNLHRRMTDSSNMTTMDHSKRRPRESYNDDKINPNCVRIGSNISFSFELFKSEMSKEPLKNYSDDNNYGDGKNHFPAKKYNNQCTDARCTTADNMTQGPSSLLKRCFCTRYLRENKKDTKETQQLNKKPDRKVGSQKATKITRGKKNQTSGKEKIVPTHQEQGTGTKFKELNGYQLDPYECEPGFCVPYQCDPYLCEKKIKERQLKYRSQSIGTSNAIMSHGTRISNEFCRPCAAQTCSGYDGRRCNKSAACNNIDENYNDTANMEIEKARPFRKRGVKCSTSIGFSIDISKGTKRSKPSRNEDHGGIQFQKRPPRMGRDRGLQSDRIRTSDRDSNVDNVLKRCFCTLKLQNKNIVPPKSLYVGRVAVVENLRKKYKRENSGFIRHKKKYNQEDVNLDNPLAFYSNLEKMNDSIYKTTNTTPMEMKTLYPYTPKKFNKKASKRELPCPSSTRKNRKCNLFRRIFLSRTKKLTAKNSSKSISVMRCKETLSPAINKIINYCKKVLWIKNRGLQKQSAIANNPDNFEAIENNHVRESICYNNHCINKVNTIKQQENYEKQIYSQSHSNYRQTHLVYYSVNKLNREKIRACTCNYPKNNCFVASLPLEKPKVVTTQTSAKGSNKIKLNNFGTNDENCHCCYCNSNNSSAKKNKMSQLKSAHKKNMDDGKKKIVPKKQEKEKKDAIEQANSKSNDNKLKNNGKLKPEPKAKEKNMKVDTKVKDGTSKSLENKTTDQSDNVKPKPIINEKKLKRDAKGKVDSKTQDTKTKDDSDKVKTGLKNKEKKIQVDRKEKSDSKPKESKTKDDNGKLSINPKENVNEKGNVKSKDQKIVVETSSIVKPKSKTKEKKKKLDTGKVKPEPNMKDQKAKDDSKNKGDSKSKEKKTKDVGKDKLDLKLNEKKTKNMGKVKPKENGKKPIGKTVQTKPIKDKSDQKQKNKKAKNTKLKTVDLKNNKFASGDGPSPGLKKHDDSCRCCVCLKKRKKSKKKTKTNKTMEDQNNLIDIPYIEMEVEAGSMNILNRDKVVDQIKYAKNINQMLKKGKKEKCVCGSKICGREKLTTKFIRPVSTAPCICGSEVCEKSVKNQYMEHVCECREEVERAKRTAIKQKKYKKEDKKRQKQRRKEERKLEDLINRSTSDGMIITESLLDLCRLLTTLTYGTAKNLIKAVAHPNETYRSVQNAANDPSRVMENASNTFKDSGVLVIAKRIKKRLGRLSILKALAKKMAQYPVTNYLWNINDPKARIKKVKRVHVREGPDHAHFNCNLYVSSLRKRPCFWVFKMCPWFYPHCLSMVTIWKQFTDICIFLLAVIVWSPCIAAMELCRAIMCCTFCTG